MSFVLMQCLSLKAWVDPKAQQAPQFVWSRTCEIDGHHGHACLGSKLVGSAAASKLGCLTGRSGGDIPSG